MNGTIWLAIICFGSSKHGTDSMIMCEVFCSFSHYNEAVTDDSVFLQTIVVPDCSSKVMIVC